MMVSHSRKRTRRGNRASRSCTVYRNASTSKYMLNYKQTYSAANSHSQIDKGTSGTVCVTKPHDLGQSVYSATKLAVVAMAIFPTYCTGHIRIRIVIKHPQESQNDIPLLGTINCIALLNCAICAIRRILSTSPRLHGPRRDHDLKCRAILNYSKVCYYS